MKDSPPTLSPLTLTLNPLALCTEGTQRGPAVLGVAHHPEGLSSGGLGLTVGLAAANSPGRLACAGASGMVGGGQCLPHQESWEYWALWVDRGWSSANGRCGHSEPLSPSDEAPGRDWGVVEGCPAHPPPPQSRPAEGRRGAGITPVFQSFGSPNKKHVGVILQRGVLVLLLCCLPCWALFLNTQLILLLCRQDPAVSRCAGPGRVMSPREAQPSRCCSLSGSPAFSWGLGLGTLPNSMLLQLWPAGGRPQPILIEKRHLYGICLHLVEPCRGFGSSDMCTPHTTNSGNRTEPHF